MIPPESQTRAWMAAWQESSDPAAGRALVDAMYPFVAALVRRHVSDPGDIEDLAQQTFVRCFSKADQWKPDKPLEPWLARIALNLCRDYFRSQKAKRELRWSDLSELEQAAMTATAQTSSCASEILYNESRNVLMRLMDTLSADDRMVLSLLYLECRTSDQIAELTGWSRALVKVRAFRARKKLRLAFERLDNTRP
jgi:RNA polymerase sigma-70 factor (ECF subfamily)